jgi:sodium/bile acid cotransporter 7
MTGNKKSSAKTSLLGLLGKAGIDGFVLLLMTMIVAAWLWPAPGAYRATVDLEKIAEWGVSLIFFFYGLKLNLTKLREDLSNWKLHITIQMVTFIIFPLLILAAIKLIPGDGNNILLTGTFFLAALPSTVSSSVVLVSIARGNIAAAIFNASLSGIAGVFITPLWMKLSENAASGNIDLSDALLKLSLQVLLPVFAGVMLNRFWGSFATHHRQALKTFDQTIILLIVYTSFCESFAAGMFQNQTTTEIITLIAAMTILFLAIFSVTWAISSILNFSTEDRITALFCGTKKSLVHGTVMSKVLFPNAGNAGVILLPLMIFHTIQLIIGSAFAQRFDKRSSKNTLTAHQ